MTSCANFWNTFQIRKQSESCMTVLLSHFDVTQFGKKYFLTTFLLKFSWNKHCFIYGKVAAHDSEHPDRHELIQVRTITFKERILQKCCNRKDELVTTVEHRVTDCIDLVASEAVCHAKSYQLFSLDKPYDCKLKINVLFSFIKVT